MTFLRIQVQCFHCNNQVDKTTARTIKAIDNKPRFECFSCFKNSKSTSHAPLHTATNKPKRQLYCQKCKYSFYSANLACPYCNKVDFLMEGDISVHDLV